MTAADIKKQALASWLRELDRFLCLKSQVYLYGNVYDCYQFPVNILHAASANDLKWANFNDIRLLLRCYLRNEGYDVICSYDMLDRFEIASADPALDGDALLKLLIEECTHTRSLFKPGTRLDQLKDVDDALDFFRCLMGCRSKLTAGILDFASRLTATPTSLEECERFRFLKLLKAAREARIFPDRGGRRNLLILICDKLNDIPPWLLLENPLTKGIEVQKPNWNERARFFRSQAMRFFQQGAPVDYEEIQSLYPDLTEGFSGRELESLVTLSLRERLHINKAQTIIDLYKLGERENFWEKLEPAKVKGATDGLGKRVLGQDRAITKSLEVIRRAKLGLDNIENPRSNKPKGVLFFAGPTGTGKTELAKALATLIFGDSDALIRFDMSEYSDKNSDVKLIGAPPGYVGYEEGGQLTTKIRARPFSIVLFDEIEKAHPVVFDKFLQILDDGRLTDGKGETAYFGESLIVFTSNLGIFREDEHGRRIPNVAHSDSYRVLAEKVMVEVSDFFNARLNRPEILNRIGDNFVVFDFIRDETGRQILRKAFEDIQTSLLEHKGWRLVIHSAFVDAFQRWHVADNLIHGGRGIHKRIESRFKNKLATFLFDSQPNDSATFEAFIDPSETDEWNRPTVRFRLL